MYFKGHGVLQDYKTGLKWFRLAAEQGHARAQYNLGVMYEGGRGVLQDNVYAHMWWNIAASSGCQGYDENGKTQQLYAVPRLTCININRNKPSL